MKIIKTVAKLTSLGVEGEHIVENDGRKYRVFFDSPKYNGLEWSQWGAESSILKFCASKTHEVCQRLLGREMNESIHRD